LVVLLFGAKNVYAGTTSLVCNYETYSDQAGLHQGSPFTIRFVIDASVKKAYMLGNNGSAEVIPVVNIDGITLIEITGSGNVMVTAVSRSGKSIHSRNTLMFKDVVPSQYYGKCDLTE
jgi:hypothetical protein